MADEGGARLYWDSLPAFSDIDRPKSNNCIKISYTKIQNKTITVVVFTVSYTYSVTPQNFGGHFFFIFFLFFFSFKSSIYFSFTYPKYMKLYCSNIFLQKSCSRPQPDLLLLTASREHRLLVYLKGGSHDGVSKAQ